MWTIPNILTLARLALLPPMIVLFFVPFSWAAWTCLGLYVIGAVTDFLDGWIARKYNQKSEFGAFLDPLSDKIFVVTLLLMLVAVGRIESLWVLSVVIIVVREFTVSGVREFMGSRDLKLPVTQLAKWKTTLQMIATGVLIIGPFIWGGQLIGSLLLTGASVITMITGWGYLKAGLDVMKKTP
ncbi:MAG: CDP-diacylglycerol--glycerol-3-phosphate 3-phosphatidyltransferase [Bdellovibrionales bacterium]